MDFICFEYYLILVTEPEAGIPYRWKFSRHEKFTKSLKTGFSCLFIHDTATDICESHANVFSIKFYSIRSIIANMH